MRALGKWSLASPRAEGQHVVRIALFCGFLGLAIAALAIPGLSFAAPLVERVGGPSVTGDLGVSAGSNVKVMGQFVSFGVMLFLVNRLLEILRTLRLGSPFARENANRFRELGFALLLLEGVKFAVLILAQGFEADLKPKFEPAAWIAVIAAFVLVEVFHQGARLKEEQDLMV